MLFSKLAGVAILLAGVNAHGVIESVNVGGQSYTDGIRSVTDNGPDATGDLGTQSLGCGKGSSPTSGSVPVKAGDTVEVQWSKSWMHKVGPVKSYLGKCSGSCSSADASSVSFNKIDEKGEENGKYPGQENIANGNPDSVTIPSGTSSGEYLLRHEIDNTSSIPNEMYEECIQLKVT